MDMNEKYDYEFGIDGYYITDMTKIHEYDPNITDEDEYRSYKIEHSLEGHEVVNKLNEQDKTIQSLKKENNHLKYKLGDRQVAFEVFASEVYDGIFDLINEKITQYTDLINIHQDDLKLKDVLMQRKTAFETIKEEIEIKAGIKHYCTDCEYMVYHDEEDEEDMDCSNGNALPEHGAPEIISGSEPNTCPYFIPKENKEES